MKYTDLKEDDFPIVVECIKEWSSLKIRIKVGTNITIESLFDFQKIPSFNRNTSWIEMFNLYHFKIIGKAVSTYEIY